MNTTEIQETADKVYAHWAATWRDVPGTGPRFSAWVKNRGSAKLANRTFTLPLWIKDEPLEYQISYVVHETTHFCGAEASYLQHNSPIRTARFNETEDEGLALFGLMVIRRAAQGAKYVRALGDLATGTFIKPFQGVYPTGLAVSPYGLNSRRDLAIRSDAPRSWSRRPSWMPACECGCGGTPRGARSRFLPGHDARRHK